MLQQKHTFYIAANAWISLSVQRVSPHYFQKASPSNCARGRRCVAGHSKTMYCFPYAIESRAKILKGTFLKAPRAPSHTGSRLAFPQGGVWSVSPNQSHLQCLSASHRLLWVGIHPLHGYARRVNKHWDTLALGSILIMMKNEDSTDWLCDSSSLFKDELAEV